MSMSLARALTLRHRRLSPSRSSSPAAGSPAAPATGSRGDNNVRRMASVIDRNKISGPVELVSTTNMLSYNAPDIATLRKSRQTSSSSSSASSSSENDSDSSSPTRSSSELTDASSVDLSPTIAEPNHLSCYFQAAQDQELKEQKKPRRAASSANVHRKAHSEDVPAVPQRALSHSKSAHMTLARKRSVQTINSTHSSSPSVKSVNGASSIREQVRTSVDLFRGSVEPNHPFGKELEKLSEVAEEFGGVVRDAEMDSDVAQMQETGLLKWTVDDYLSELRPLYSSIFGRNHPTAISPAWI